VVCSSGVGFDPLVDGTRYTFSNAGLYNGLFVMQDDQTGSTWTHYDGTVLQGPLAGTDVALEIQPLVHTPWADWLDEHPDTLVPVRETGYEDRYQDVEPGRPGLGPRFEETLLREDPRLPGHELVLGADLGGEYRAYVLADLPPGPSVVSDELAGQPVVVFADAGSDFALAFCARTDGETLEFSVADGRWTSVDGTEWSSSGRATAGPRAGTQLGFVTSFVTEWYGWSGYHPSTSIHGR
jgi:hypothetical protein